MGGCGLCRPKVQSPMKTHQDFSSKKINRIDTWIENIEGPCESIALPTKPPDPFKVTSNRDEINENQRNNHMSNFKTSPDPEDHEQTNMQHLSSELSTGENDTLNYV
ncbi:unnamed protein product [Adineta ricciae]|uniref:Uncharacterized protein n=1 Tax=Adineta ricciae TaxID=249248 RepID=A0A815RTM2_ADIRI|nr:unnamed protein product [Adineta ricciae]